MPQTDQLLKNFINKLPQELIQSPDTQKMALDVYYTSITNVLLNNMTENEVNKILQKTADNNGSLEIMRNEVPDFDNKVFEEFTNLIKAKASYDLRV